MRRGSIFAEATLSWRFIYPLIKHSVRKEVLHLWERTPWNPFFSFLGYGQVVPVTRYGRLATIFYGLFGIPMMLLFLANLGSLMADVFRMLYKSLCCCFISDKKRDSPAPIHSTACAAVRGPNKPSANCSNSPLALRDIPGRVAFNGSPNTPQRGGRKKTSALQELVRKTAPLPGITESLFITLAGSNSVFTKALQARKESRNVRVPVWLILCLFTLYMILGALVFAYWEQWTFLDAMYFVFVTVSTIGFGDMLPGIDDPHPVHRMNKFIAANVYLLLGLAMVAMCFDLMQLEVKRSSKRLARRIGLISSMWYVGRHHMPMFYVLILRSWHPYLLYVLKTLFKCIVIIYLNYVNFFSDWVGKFRDFGLLSHSNLW